MSSVDGLVSGMNTSQIIQQLMQLERMPVTRLEMKKLVADKAITAYQGLNTKFLAIAELAKKLSAATGWSPMKATITPPDAVGVVVAEGAAPTSLSFTVKSVVAAHQTYSAAAYAAPTTQVADAGAPITIDSFDAAGNPVSLQVANHDGTLKGIADAINATAASPVTARLVKTSDAGDYRLEFTAKQAGAKSAFSVSGITLGGGPDMAFNVATQASDAEILLGSSGTPLSIKSSSNTLAEVMPGVSVTVRKADLGTTVKVDVARDTATITADVEKLVAAANEFLKEAKSLTSYDPVSKKSGLLQGNGAVRDLQSAVLNAVSNAIGGTSAGSVGIELTRDGLVKFDKAKFETAYTANPASVAAIFTGPVGLEGIAQRLLTVADRATKSTIAADGSTIPGRLTQAIDSRRNEIKRIDASISMWDVRLDRKEAALRRQYAALEKALGAAQSQGNWLAGQLAQLPSASAQ